MAYEQHHWVCARFVACTTCHAGITWDTEVRLARHPWVHPTRPILLCRDDVNHKGEGIDWGQWAITGDDPDFGGTGNPDTGDDYGPAPGTFCAPQAMLSQQGMLQQMKRHVVR